MVTLICISTFSRFYARSLNLFVLSMSWSHFVSWYLFLEISKASWICCWLCHLEIFCSSHSVFPLILFLVASNEQYLYWPALSDTHILEPRWFMFLLQRSFWLMALIELKNWNMASCMWWLNLLTKLDLESPGRPFCGHVCNFLDWIN